MKVRFSGDEIRFRIRLEELDAILAGKGIETSLSYVREEGSLGVAFRFTIRPAEGEASSRFVLGHGSVDVLISREDVEVLRQGRQEGIYLQREQRAPDGSVVTPRVSVERELRVDPTRD